VQEKSAPIHTLVSSMDTTA